MLLQLDFQEQELPSFLTLGYLPVVLLLVVCFYYLITYAGLWRLRDIPGPKLAAFSNYWFLLQSRQGSRALVVDEAHKKHGKMICLGPRHVSIADEPAIQAIYGHGNKLIKS